MFVKRKKLVIYYIVVILFILLGFVVGRWEEEFQGGYDVCYGDPKPHTTLDGGTMYYRDSYELGDFCINKNIGWYRITFKSSNTYLVGNNIDNAFVLTYDMATNDGINLLFDREDFEGVSYHTEKIIIACIIWILLFAFPLIISVISKLKNKTSIKKNLKKLNELDYMKQQGLISEEQYNQRRESLIEKTKNRI